MNKKEVLKKLGFSDEYLKILDESMHTGTKEIKLDATWSSEVIDYKIYDSAEMHIETGIQHSSTTLKIT